MLDKHAPLAVETAAPTVPFDDPECQYVALPETMKTFVAPSLHAWGEIPEGRVLLARLAENLAAQRQGQAAPPIDLMAYTADIREFVGQVLGEGEISILADSADGRLGINEAVFTGVWRIRHYQDGWLAQDYLETGAIPAILADWVAGHDEPPPFPASFPDTLMNAPPLAHELFAKSRAFAPGREEIVNLTLLPMTPEDLAFLADCLGLAGVSILSKGYGECRMRRTKLPNVWWVQHLNSTGQLILNTLEITALPSLAMAAPEDLEDSGARLEDVLAGLD
jgi:hydrogenase-1 operon protein HyaF